jgi:hypothetical protein
MKNNINTNGKAYRISEIQKEITRAEQEIKKDYANCVCMIILIPACTIYLQILDKFNFIQQCINIFVR